MATVEFPSAKPANFRKLLERSFYSFDRSLKFAFQYEGEFNGVFSVKEKGEEDLYGSFSYRNDPIIDGQAFMAMHCVGFYVTHDYKVGRAHPLQSYDFRFEMQKDLADIKGLHAR